jgi:hypothetical protein
MTVALLLPTTALSGDLVFDCGAPDAAHPEMVAHLTKFYGQKKGHITIGDIERVVDVYPGLDTLTFLYIGEGYALHYNVNPAKGTFDYSASGSMSGHGRGTCEQISS